MKKSFKYFLAYSFITLLLLSLDIFLLTRKKRKRKNPKAMKKRVSSLYLSFGPQRLALDYIRNLVDIIPFTKYIKWITLLLLVCLSFI